MAKYRITPQGRTTFTDEQDEIIKDNYLEIPVKRLAAILGKKHDISVHTRIRQLGLIIPPEIVEKRKLSRFFKKGHTPYNKGLKQIDFLSEEQIEVSKKTQFKKGHIPATAVRKPGTIRVRGYGQGKKRKRVNYKVQFIQLEDFSWQPLHIHNWEKINGKVPEGYVLWFKDGVTMNAESDNIELITREESIKRNSIHRYPEDLKKIMFLKGKLNQMINNRTKS